MYQKHTLAAAGSTGNVTGDALPCGGVYDSAILQFVVEAIGATPTVTFKFQGTVDDVNWFDLAYVTDASDTTSVAGRTVTTVAAFVNFLANPVARKYKAFRVVTSANTNVTYRAELYLEA